MGFYAVSMALLPKKERTNITTLQKPVRIENDPFFKISQ
jgi:hypothetical protein